MQKVDKVSYLYSYVRNAEECNVHCKEEIRQLILEVGQEVDEPFTVYRGHKGGPNQIYTSVPWFSVSLDRNVSKQEFTNKECCLFIIHVMPGVNYLDVNQALQVCEFKAKGVYKVEKELLLLGGGVFYADKDGKTRGFKLISEKEGHYETWYFQSPIPHPVVNENRKKRNNNTRAKPKISTTCKTPISIKTIVQRLKQADDTLVTEEELQTMSPETAEYLKMYLNPNERLPLPGEDVQEGGKRKRRLGRRHTRRKTRKTS